MCLHGKLKAFLGGGSGGALWHGYGALSVRRGEGGPPNAQNAGHGGMATEATQNGNTRMRAGWGGTGQSEGTLLEETHTDAR